MENKKFKKFISFMLAVVMLIIPLSGTARAIDERPSAATEICGFDTATARTQLLANDTYVARCAWKSSYAEPWILTYDSMYGCFRIQDADTGYYLTAPEMPVNGGYITQEPLSGSLESRQLWSFAISSSGYYVIQSQNVAGTAYVLTLDVYSDELKQIYYTDDTNYCDEWEIIPFVGWVKLNILRDSAYSQRFDYSSARIRSHMITMQEKYLDEFGIYVDYGSSADYLCTYITDYASYPETSSVICPNNCDTVYDSVCNYLRSGDFCANSTYRTYTNGQSEIAAAYEYHHKNLFNIWYRLPFPDVNESLTMLFSGHKMCVNVEYDLNNPHKEHPYAGIANSDLGIMMCMSFGSDNYDLSVTVHEFGHMFGVIDHYGSVGQASTQELKNKTGKPYNQACIYGELKNQPNIISNLIICDACRETIEANAGKFNHGN